MKIYEGKLVSEGVKVGIVVARFKRIYYVKAVSRCHRWSEAP